VGYKTRVSEMSKETPVTVCILYPIEAALRFDLEYYIANHIPMVRVRWQPLGLTANKICAVRRGLTA
jgi:hypothetical protein